MKALLILIVVFIISGCTFRNKEAEDLNTLALQKSDSEAVLLLNKAIEIDPNSASYFYNRASAKYKMRNFNEAIKDCKEAIRLCKDCYKTYALLGCIYHDTGDGLNGAISFTNYLRFDSLNYVYFLLRGKCFYLIDSNQLAINDFDTYLTKTDSARIDAFNYKIITQMKLKEFNSKNSHLAITVLNELDSLIKIYPLEPIFYFHRSTYFSHFGDFNNSLININTAISLSKNSDLYNLHYSRGLIYYYYGKLNDACLEWEKDAAHGNKYSLDARNKFCEK